MPEFTSVKVAASVCASATAHIYILVIMEHRIPLFLYIYTGENLSLTFNMLHMQFSVFILIFMFHCLFLLNS